MSRGNGSAATSPTAGSSIIQVNFGALDSGAQGIQATHAQLQGLFNQLQSNVNQLLPTWDGAARDAYYAVQRNWNTLSAEMQTALQQMGKGVTTANQNFQRAERANLTGWGGGARK